VQTLLKRREKIGRHWFSKINPLDYFNIEDDQNGMKIGFKDLAVTYDLEPDNALYRHQIKYKGKKVLSNREFSANSFILSNNDLSQMSGRYNERSDNSAEDHLFEIRLQTKRAGRGWSKPTLLWLWYFPEQDHFQLVGIEHLD
ncbi:MAG: hypothetical protein JSV44_01340, partial [Candidatus Zixiibacteriota bacterium]